MKLQTQFTVPNKELRDLDYVNKVKVLEETFKRECLDYPNQKDYLVYCDWLYINHFFIVLNFWNIHQFINKRG